MEQSSDLLVRLPNDVITEILLRLPAKSVLRCRAVCKRWRLIATGSTFLASHARRRPLEVLVYATFQESGSRFHIGLDAVPLSGEARRRLLHYPKYPPGGTERGAQYCLLLASCDGLLLFRQDPGLYFVCNPLTRQWIELPRLTPEPCSWAVDSGFYFHQPSAEYRLMCHGRTAMGSAYYILSAGVSNPRRVKVCAAPLTTKSAFSYSTPVALRGNLHWLQHPEAGDTGKMVAFDTVSETFRRMLPPPDTTLFVKLFDMDGVLMVSDAQIERFDLWVLEDYDLEVWTCRHRVTVPWQFGVPESGYEGVLRKYMLSAAVAGAGGDVILGSLHGFVVYNVKAETVVIVDLDSDDVVVSRHVFRESLVQHSFFGVHPSPGLPLLRFC